MSKKIASIFLIIYMGRNRVRFFEKCVPGLTGLENTDKKNIWVFLVFPILGVEISEWLWVMDDFSKNAFPTFWYVNHSIRCIWATMVFPILGVRNFCRIGGRMWFFEKCDLGLPGPKITELGAFEQLWFVRFWGSKIFLE